LFNHDDPEFLDKEAGSNASLGARVAALLQADRARVAGGQCHEVRYEARKTGKSNTAVKRATKKAGTSRKKVERELAQVTINVD
jgi:hypothetical protein